MPLSLILQYPNNKIVNGGLTNPKTKTVTPADSFARPLKLKFTPRREKKGVFHVFMSLTLS